MSDPHQYTCMNCKQLSGIDEMLRRKIFIFAKTDKRDFENLLCPNCGTTIITRLKQQTEN